MGIPGRRSARMDITKADLVHAEQSVMWKDKQSDIKYWHWVVPYKGQWKSLCMVPTEDLFWATGKLKQCSRCAYYNDAIAVAKADAKQPTR